MKRSIRDAWVNALRSGEYTQGTGNLHMVTPEGQHEYCCLGVLCDLAEQAGEVNSKRIDGTHRVAYTYAAEGDGPVREWSETHFAPAPVRKWSGLASGDPTVDADVPRSLSELNDELHLTFDQIADLIEHGIPADDDE